MLILFPIKRRIKQTVAVQASPSGLGDFIQLGPGAYFENVTVSQNVAIHGDSALGSAVNKGFLALVLFLLILLVPNESHPLQVVPGLHD